MVLSFSSGPLAVSEVLPQEPLLPFRLISKTLSVARLSGWWKYNGYL